MISTDNMHVKQKSYSQNAEDLFVLDYFKGFKGTLLEIGANDGRTLSNSLLLIENGWKAHLIEPGRKVFDSLYALHAFNPRVKLYNYGIGEQSGIFKFYESGEHVLHGGDLGLVSSIDYDETERWRNSGVKFDEIEVNIYDWQTFYNKIDFPSPNFDFISIDAEGFDWQILKQIDLNAIGCSCLVIEWNKIQVLKAQFIDYCGLYGLKLANENAENLLFIK